MIEFTLSRVVLCICGVVLIATVAGALDGIYDNDRDEMDGTMADRFAYMLDVFQSSGTDELVLDGNRLLPEGYTVVVHEGFVEILYEERRQISVTDYKGEFKLDWNDTIRITRRRSRRSS